MKSLLRRNVRLNEKQIKNLARFIKKIPSNSKSNVQVSKLSNGNIKFTATSPGKVPNSKSVYEKIVNFKGKTVGFKKTTYDNKGELVHVKNKFKK